MSENKQLSLLAILELPRVEALYKPDQIFETNDYTLLTRLTEDDRFDRKSSRVEPKALAVCLSAFGNGPSILGGVIAIGITNNGEIEGCQAIGERRIQECEAAGQDRCPFGKFKTKRIPVINKDGQHDFIILIRIYYVEDKLVELSDGSAFKRIGHECKELNDDKKQEVRIDKGERSFELDQCNLIYPDDFRINDIKKFAKHIRDSREGSEEITDEQILEAMHLGRKRDDAFLANNACVLMFAKDPQQIFPGCYVHFLRFNGTAEGSGKDYNVVKDRMINGTILDIIKGTASILDANLREFTEYRNGKFTSVPEYPQDAWYELLVNACVHRSYFVRNAPIFVKMFDDKLIVESPGGFMPQVTPQNIYEMHRPRNPFLMFALREYGEVRCINEGTKRVKKEMSDANLPAPEFYQESSTGTAVRATLKNSIGDRTNSLDSEAYKIIGEALALSLDDEDRKIVNFVIENRSINVSGALRIMKTTYWHSAKAKLDKLVSRGVLDHVSNGERDPKAHYILRGAK